EHQAAAAPGRPPLPRPARECRRRRDRDGPGVRGGSESHGTAEPPPPACLNWASSAFARLRSLPSSPWPLLPCHLVKKLWTWFVYATPEAMIGEVVECGLPKIFRKVEKCGSGWISGECSDSFVVGTLRILFENWARKCGSVVRYFTTCQDSSLWLPPFGIPMIVPLM